MASEKLAMQIEEDDDTNDESDKSLAIKRCHNGVDDEDNEDENEEEDEDEDDDDDKDKGEEDGGKQNLMYGCMHVRMYS